MPDIDMDDDGGLGGAPGPPLSRRTPFYRGFFLTLGALLAVLVAVAVREAASALVLVLIAAFLAIGLEPVVGYFGRRGINRPWAVLAIGVLFVAVIGTVVYVLGTVLANQITSLVDDAPKLIDELRRNHTVAKLDHKYHFLSGLQDKLTGSKLGKDALTGALGVGVSVFNALANTVIVFVLMLYFIGSAPQLKAALYLLAPASRRGRVRALGDEVLHRVGRYAIGALAVAALAGTVTAIFTVSVGLGEYALPLAILVALLDLVPLVGAIIGAGSVCLVGFATSLPVGITCVIFYLIYELLEGYVVYPRVMRSSVDVPEYVTIVAVLVGGAVAGIVGALLALPVAATILLLIREVWVRRQDVS
ncbi:MAG: AI-2E family transporter [Jatrophihabitans sp.]